METKDVILNLRTKNNLSQEELAEKVFVTRQAVSRWETGETIPNTDTLKLLSRIFDVSINTLLGEPRQLVCQCCGMPMNDSVISKESNGSFNEDYCKWCYADGTYTYSDMDNLIDVCVSHMSDGIHSEAEIRSYLHETLPRLDYWKRFDELNDGGKFEKLKATLIDEINGLNIHGMPKLTCLNALVGSFVNIEYTLPNGSKAKFLNDNTTYLGNQLEAGDKCYGVLANVDFILICTYEQNGENPELIMYKKR